MKYSFLILILSFCFSHTVLFAASASPSKQKMIDNPPPPPIVNEKPNGADINWSFGPPTSSSSHG